MLFMFLILIIGLISFFEAEPATRTKRLEILNQKLDDEESIQIYIELIDYLNEHKAAMMNTTSMKDTSDCVDFLALPFDYQRQLSKDVITHSNKILSKLKGHAHATVVVCRNNSITLNLFQEDRTNYLYIHHSFYLNDFLKRKEKLDNYRGKLIEGKYFYFVRVEDAFNYMDPNNFAAN